MKHLPQAALLALLAVSCSGEAAAADAAMPFDLAFSRTQLGYDERPSISPDGKMLAYTTHSPPAKSPPSGDYLPNGVPASAIGNAVRIANLATHDSRAVGPQGANCWRPSFSPDSTRLALYCDTDGASHLWIYDVASNASHQLGKVKIKPSLWAGDEPQWSTDGTEIFVPLAPPATEPVRTSAAVVSEESEVRVYTAGGAVSKEKISAEEDGDLTAFFMRENNAGLGAVSASTGAVRTVVAADATPPPSVLQRSPTGKWLAYLSVFRMPPGAPTTAYHDLAVVPAQGGEPHVVAPDIVLTQVHYHLNAYIWHPARDQLFWVKDDRLWTIDLSSAAAEPRQLAPQLADLTRQPLAVTHDGTAVIVGVHPLDLRDYNNPYPQALAIVPLASGTPKIIDLPPGFVFRSVLFQRGSAAWQPQANAITILGQDRATAQNTVIRLDLRSGQSRVLWKGLAQLRTIAGSPADQRMLIASFENLDTPPDFYGFDADFGHKRRLTNIEPRLANVRFGPAETFESVVPQYDGSTAKVTTAMMLPPGTKRGDRLPTLVFLYPGEKVSASAAEFGGGSVATVPVSIFTTRGYAVLLSELPISPDGKAGNPISEIVDALLPQVYRAAELGYTDVNRVAVSGQSYGGYATASAISGTNLFRAGIAISGLYDLPGLYAWMDRKGVNINSRWSESQGRMGTHPWADLQRYLDNSPYYRAGRIQAPLLMLHGQADDTCPVEDARKMFNALERLGRTAELAEYAGEGHSISGSWGGWSLANANDAARRMVEFLDTYVRNSKPQPAF